MRVLLVKMSSLGDIVHTLPAVEDAACHGVEFDWVAEEGFTAIPQLHRGVKRVIPIALRRWRNTPVASFDDLRRFRAALRERRYDLVLDAQGLAKSAIVGCWAMTDRYVGFASNSARERVASMWYDERLAVPRGAHAVDRLRALFAEAIGYDETGGKPRFGIETELSQTPSNDGSTYGVLLHGTTWGTKQWPEAFWIEVAGKLAAMGIEPRIPSIDQHERERAERIAAAVSGVRVLPPMELSGAIDLLRSSSVTIGVDSGLAHLSAALGRPTVMLFGPTCSTLTGCRGARAVNLQSEIACSPCLKADCRYRGDPVDWQGTTVDPPCFASVNPERVVAAALEQYKN